MASVLIVSYHFAPSSAVGGRRSARFARALLERGHAVTVVCGTPLPTDPPSVVAATLSPPDPSQLHLVDDRIDTLRLETRYPLGRNLAGGTRRMSGVELWWWKARAYAEAFLPTPSWEAMWSKTAAELVAGRIAAGEFDIVIASVPPAQVVHGVVAAARESGVPVVADFRDLSRPGEEAPGTFRRLPGEGARLRRRDRALIEVYAAADRIVLSSEEAAEFARLECDYIDGERLRVVTNAFDRPDERVARPEPGRPIELLYTGSLAYGRDAQLLALLGGLHEMRRRGRTDLRLRVVGGSTEEIRAAIADHDLSDAVDLAGWLTREEVVEAQRRADALLLLQPAGSPEIEVAIPAKLFEYMERRKNIFSLAPIAGDRVVREHGLGLVARAGRPGEAADSLCELVDLVRDRPVLPPPPEAFSTEGTCAEFIEIVEDCVASGPLERAAAEKVRI